MIIILDAKIVKTAVPTTDNAIGSVERDLIGLSWDPTIPLKNIVTVAAVNPKIWLNANNQRFLFIKFCNNDITNQQTQNQDP